MSNSSQTYKAVVKSGRNFGPLNTCRLAISVGQSYHEGQKLIATFNWAAKRFNHIIVSVNDTLQRHNFQRPDAHEFTKAEGDAWIQRNIDAIALAPDARIERWDEWLNDPQYPKMRARVQKLYDTHQGFRNDINLTATRFAERRGTHPSDSIAYLLEETAIFAMQSEQQEAVDAYPGTAMAIWERFTKEDIPLAPQGLKTRHFTRIDFKRLANVANTP